MGTAPLSPTIDVRLARTIVKYHLPIKKIQVLWRIFNKYDTDRTGYITADDFFDRIIKYKQTCMTDKLFQVIESESDVLLSFGEFVELVTVFACFEREDLVNYFFFAMDLNRTGRIGKSELNAFVHGMWGNETTQDGLSFLDSMESGRGNFNFKQVHHMQQHNPVVLYPLYNLQTHIRKHTLGDRWNSIITHHEDHNHPVFAQLKHKEKSDLKARDGLTDEMVRQRMGKARYYLTPWRRSAERAHMLRMVAVLNTTTPRSTGTSSIRGSERGSDKSSARGSGRGSDPDLHAGIGGAGAVCVTKTQVPFS